MEIYCNVQVIQCAYVQYLSVMSCAVREYSTEKREGCGCPVRFRVGFGVTVSIGIGIMLEATKLVNNRLEIT